MKPTRNNEIDLLLRGLARGKGSKSVSPASGEDSVHLDADELNSYAERVLPAATLARYTTHVADCSRCRRIVSELARASVGSGREQVPLGFWPGLWQKLQAFLSPPVLRYAVPTLALFAVVAISWVALRQPRPSGFLAQNGSPAVREIPANEDTENKRAVKTDDAQTGTMNKRAYQTTVDTKADKRAKTQEENTASIPTATGSADTVTAISPKEASSGRAVGGVAQREVAAEPAAVPAAPKSQTAAVETRGGEAGRKEEQAEKYATARAREGERAQRQPEAKDEPAPAKAGNAPLAARDARGLRMEARRADVDAAKKKTEEKSNAENETAEIRTVNGRRFRRQGNIWIDTAYSSSIVTITVTRGSEQYRALIADEPGIRPIAEQLTGEVILVWKGRAYRIR